MRRIDIVACVGIVLCAASCTTASSSTAQAAPRVDIHSFAFSPHTITVPAGTQITWMNQDSITHTVTSGVPGSQGAPGVTKDVPPSPDGTFDDELAGSGSTATVLFDHPGTFTYFCRIHAGMTGEVTVT